MGGNKIRKREESEKTEDVHILVKRKRDEMK